MRATHERLRKLTTLQNRISNTLEMAYVRWQDEKDYEDINDYAVAFKPAVEELGFTFLKMTKRPFGFQFLAFGEKCQAYCNSHHLGIKST